MLRVLSALLREDVVGLRTRSPLVHRSDGAWLRLATPATAPCLLPVAEDGFQACTTPGCPPAARVGRRRADRRRPGARRAARRLRTPRTGPGSTPFAEECRQTLATMRLHDEIRGRASWQALGGPARGPGLARQPGVRDPRRSARPSRSTRRRAAARGSPRSNCGPTHRSSTRASRCAGSRCRGTAVTLSRRSAGVVADAGRAGSAPSSTTRHLMLPVHPLSAGDPLEQALRPPVSRTARCSPTGPYLDVVPTLSMRTVATAARPGRASETAAGHRHAGAAQPADDQARHAGRRCGHPAAARAGDRP